MTDKPTIEWFKDRLGITANIVERLRDGHKPAYKVHLARHQTVDLIKIVGPYLVTKRNLAFQIWQEYEDEFPSLASSNEE